MKKSGLKATTLRAILIIIIFIIICVSSVSFYFAKSFLANLNAEIGNNTSGKTTSEQDAQSLDQLRSDINSHKAIAAKADGAVALSQGYETQITTDLKKYASSNNIQMTNYLFSQPATDENNVLKTMPGLQIKTIDITLGNPIAYTSFIKFLKEIESNLPIMQVEDIVIARDSKLSDSITVEPLTIEFYIK